MDNDKYKTITDAAYVLNGSLTRIADAMEEVLRLVKKDQQDTAERIARLQEKEKDE